MSTKIDVRPVISDHVDTLVNQSRDGSRPRTSVVDIAVQYLLPVACGGVFFVLGGSLRAVSSILSGAAILTAFSFALAIFAFQARSTDQSTRGSARLRLLDEFFRNVLYSVLVGLCLTITLVACSAFGVRDDEAGPVGGGLVIVVGVHYVLVLLMCIKRLRAAYRDLER